MPRFRANPKEGGKPIPFSDGRSKAWEDSIFGQAFKYKPPQPIEGPIALGVVIYRAMTKAVSNSKKKKKQALERKLLPTTKPDIKNLVANVEDALNGVFWVDDAQIVQYIDVDGVPTGKYYGETPRVEVLIRPLMHPSV
jgi:Holliday junction resolvase RusA-like endonuclease